MCEHYEECHTFRLAKSARNLKNWCFFGRQRQAMDASDEQMKIMASWLPRSVPTTSPPKPRTPDSTRCVEDEQYGTYCKKAHRLANDDLERWQYKRALVVRFTGRKDWWGLGHALQAVFDIHHVCRLLRRFCYISIFEMNLGLMFGYKNGMSWHPEPAELDKYRDRTVIRDFPAWFNFFHPKNPPFLARARTLDNVSLLEVRSLSSIAFPRPFLYGTLPLPPNVRASRPGWWSKLHAPPPWATRCFCRFVSEARFEYARRVPAVVYHLRTGFADVSDNFLAGLSTHNCNHSAVARWLKLACPQFTERPRVHVISDSPAIVAYYRSIRVGPARATSLPIIHSVQKESIELDLTLLNARSASVTSTRSWDNSFEAQVGVARDMCEGGQAQTVHFGMLSSFVAPMIARSMCIKHINPVDDLRLLVGQSWVPGAKDILLTPSIADKMAEDVPTRCPLWSTVFPRNMFTDIALPSQNSRRDARARAAERWNKLSSHLPSWHPCFGGSREACQAEFLAATAPC